MVLLIKYGNKALADPALNGLNGEGNLVISKVGLKALEEEKIITNHLNSNLKILSAVV